MNIAGPKKFANVFVNPIDDFLCRVSEEMLRNGFDVYHDFHGNVDFAKRGPGWHLLGRFQGFDGLREYRKNLEWLRR